MFTDNHLSPLSTAQIKSACLAMLEVAHAGGELHPAELSLIRSFWESAEPALPAFDANNTEAFSPALFTEQSHKLLLLDLCVACAFADGNYSSEEKQVTASVAEQLGLSAQVLAERTADVRASFLGSLSHLPDAQSVAALAQHLE